MKTNFTESAQ